MSDFVGGLVTRKLDCAFIAFFCSRACDRRLYFHKYALLIGASLQIKFCPDRGMIRRFFSLTHFPIDPRCRASLRERFTRQNCIDT